MAATQEMIRIACEVRPDIVTLVPERPEEVTTEGGLNVVHHKDAIRSAANLLGEHEIELSLFVDPDLDQIKAAREVGAQVIEINTGRYCEAKAQTEREREYQLIVDTIRYAAKLRLEVAAGHDLNVKNVGPIAAIPEVRELNIGHSIIARAIFVGLERAVREMIEAMQKALPLELT